MVKYYWCCHCGQCFPDSVDNKRGKFYVCPYYPCDGEAIKNADGAFGGDFFEWDRVKGKNDPNVPELGKVYRQKGYYKPIKGR